MPEMKCVKISKTEHHALRRLYKKKRQGDNPPADRSEFYRTIIVAFQGWLCQQVLAGRRRSLLWVVVPTKCPRGQVSVPDDIHRALKRIAKTYNVSIQCALETACATYRRTQK